MLSVEFYYSYAECRFAECHSAKGRSAYPRPVQQDFSPWYSKLVRLLLSVLSTFARYFRERLEGYLQSLIKPFPIPAYAPCAKWRVDSNP
jgi:hypothetical protein